jgi:ABC-type Fe3+-hydroxamate transport system substrate-binding protein
MNEFPHLASPPERIVSLVPSMTESLFDLGLGARLVGVSDYCVLPAAGVAHLPRVGGTKTPEVEKIAALAPDLVIANQEENAPETITLLRERNLAVWLTFPRTVIEALADLHTIAGVFGSRQMAMQVDWLVRSAEWARAAVSESQNSVFCPIWREASQGAPRWWMTFCGETFASDVLTMCGGRNVFADRMRRYPLEAEWGEAQEEEPGGRDDRYPRVTLDEILAAGPQVILLPSEPYAFSAGDGVTLLAAFADRGLALPRVAMVDGKLLFWHGTHLAKAMLELPGILP